MVEFDFEEPEVEDNSLSHLNRERIRIRQLRKTLKVIQSADIDPTIVQPIVKQSRNMVLQRFLGFDNELRKLDGEKSGAWKLTDCHDHNNKPHCWVCGQHIYSILLWNENIGKL